MLVISTPMPKTLSDFLICKSLWPCSSTLWLSISECLTLWFISFCWKNSPLLRSLFSLGFSLPLSMLPESLLFALISDLCLASPRAEAYLFSPSACFPFQQFILILLASTPHLYMLICIKNPARVLIPHHVSQAGGDLWRSQIEHVPYDVSCRSHCCPPHLIYTLYLTNN